MALIHRANVRMTCVPQPGAAEPEVKCEASRKFSRPRPGVAAGGKVGKLLVLAPLAGAGAGRSGSAARANYLTSPDPDSSAVAVTRRRAWQARGHRRGANPRPAVANWSASEDCAAFEVGPSYRGAGAQGGRSRMLGRAPVRHCACGLAASCSFVLLPHAPHAMSRYEPISAATGGGDGVGKNPRCGPWRKRDPAWNPRSRPAAAPG